MHYKNGRPAKNGDKVLLRRSYGPPVIGILYNAQEGNNDCNGNLATCTQADPCPDLKECLHVDDIREASYPPEPSKLKSLRPTDQPPLDNNAHVAQGCETFGHSDMTVADAVADVIRRSGYTADAIIAMRRQGTLPPELDLRLKVADAAQRVGDSKEFTLSQEEAGGGKPAPAEVLGRQQDVAI